MTPDTGHSRTQIVPISRGWDDASPAFLDTRSGATGNWLLRSWTQTLF